MLTHVAHQGPSHPVTPWLHPRRQVISSGEITSRKLKKRSGRPADSQLTAQVLVQAQPERQAAIGKLTNPRTVAHCHGRALLSATD
jgi:hypothetical protein